MFPTLLASVVSGEALIAIRRLRSAVVIYVLATLLILVGLGFLTGTAYIALFEEVGSFYASLYFGIGFVALAVVLLIIFRIVSAMRVRTARRRKSTEARALVSAAAIAAIPALLSARRGGRGLIATAVAGAVTYFIYQEWKPKPGQGPRRDD